MKRFSDLVLLFLTTPLWIPLLLLVALLVRLKIGTPVFFRQQRPGQNGIPFEIIKFRTMTDAKGLDGKLLPDSERLTSFGRWLRSSSLDELPELLNVLKGEMSLVGPRPLLVHYVALYTPRQARRHEVKPGITGWAQINGRNVITWSEKFELDLWYIEHQSISLDLKILLLTLKKVLIREGISAVGDATMPEFRGTPDPS